MKLNISIENKEDIERFILIINIGLLTAIKEGVVSIEETENCLYSPYSVGKIKDLNVSEEIVKLVELGCELEDVESLVPDKLDDSINEINKKSFELLRLVRKTEFPLKKWID